MKMNTVKIFLKIDEIIHNNSKILNDEKSIKKSWKSSKKLLQTLEC